MAYAPIAKLEKFTGKEDDTQNLHQIQAIDANYFTVAQILNQFIRGLYSSILQCICPMHPVNLQAAITNARDFEAIELEANHTQAINLAKIDPTKLKIVNGSPPTDSQFFHTTSRILTTEFKYWVHPTPKFPELFKSIGYPEDAQPNNPETNQYLTLTSNILPATITENKLLDAIFLFEFKELSTTLLFSGAALEKKLITAMYIDAKVDDYFIKLILDSKSAGSIITKQFIDQLDCQVNHTASTKIITTNGATKTPIGKIDDFFFEVNGIIISIKVLVIEATQY
ncbi:hypothetical protein G9A89_010333 [Geosiphon pyriformis]|nr:hypothetical protein G9A89_010333 [Geosiphon pyriformis]